MIQKLRSEEGGKIFFKLLVSFFSPIAEKGFNLWMNSCRAESNIKVIIRNDPTMKRNVTNKLITKYKEYEISK